MVSLRLIVNARIATGDPHRPWADAMVLTGLTLVTIGSSAELRKRFGAQAEVIDAAGATLVPDDPASMSQVVGPHVDQDRV